MKHMQRCERVVVTGLGIICSLGHDIETVWNAVLASETAAGPVKIFDASTFPTTFAAEVRDYDFTKFINRPELHGQVRRSPRFAIGAAALTFVASM